ncbi:MAG: BT4734/BF3469 family protein [Chitinophagaceae bacterium]
MTPKAKIQFYNNVKDNLGKEITVQDTIAYITGNELVPMVSLLRKLGEAIVHLQRHSDEEKAEDKWKKWIKERQKEYDDQKKKLPAVTWSGTFTKRSAKNIKDYSGLLCIDIDKIDSPETLRKLKDLLKSDPYTFLVFTSPGGKGLKVIVKVDGGADKHLSNFLSLEKYYKAKYKIEVDPSGKDTSRLCFLAPDTNFLLEVNSKTFIADDTLALDKKELPVLQYHFSEPEQKELTSTGNSLDDVKQFTDKLYKYAAGMRNQYCFMFSLNANRKGIDISETLTYLEAFASDLDIKELAATVQSAYKNNITEHGKYANRVNNGINKNKPKQVRNAADKQDIPGNDKKISGKAVSADTAAPLFYFEHEDEKLKDKKGNPLLRYTLYYTGLIDFLEHGGYHRLPMQNGTYEFILYKNNICETIQPLHMKDYVVDWCKVQQKRGVLEMLIKGSERYFNVNKLNTLPYKQLEFVKDTATDAYFFFRNCYVKVTKDEITTHTITDFQKTLWKSSIIDRDFSLHPFDPHLNADNSFAFDKWPCEMAKFVALVSCNPNSKDEVSPENRAQRFDAICSSIGYMLHGFKNKNGKAIIAVDHKIPEDRTEQNGGTGKSIVGESFRHLKSSTIIDGREFREDYPFRFEMVGVDTQIVIMQDCKLTLDFGTFFVPITNDFTYNRRHTGYVTIKYEDSPKWWFDTNFVFKGEGSSHRRRMHVIEFDDFFNDEHTPLDEFGHYLFQDWDAVQWNLFFNFYFSCVQLYLAEGLIAYPQSNYEQRKLLVDAPQEFIDFIDAHESKEHVNGDGSKYMQDVYKVKRNTEHIKKDLMKLWNDESSSLNMFKSTPHQFTKWMKKYCATKLLNLLKRKTNGVEYYTLADASYKPHGKAEQSNLPF